MMSAKQINCVINDDKNLLRSSAENDGCDVSGHGYCVPESLHCARIKMGNVEHVSLGKCPVFTPTKDNY